LNILFLHVGLV